MESFTEEDCQLWAAEFRVLCRENGFCIERLGGMIDVIVGRPGASVTRRDFFRFQRLFEEFNERLGWRMSALLWLAEGADRSSSMVLVERYINGRIQEGDSIGRPCRHSLREIRNIEKSAHKSGSADPDMTRSVAERRRHFF